MSSPFTLEATLGGPWNKKKKDNVPRAAINGRLSSAIGHPGASAGPQRSSAAGVLRRSIARCVVASRRGVDGGSHRAQWSSIEASLRRGTVHDAGCAMVRAKKKQKRVRGAKATAGTHNAHTSTHRLDDDGRTGILGWKMKETRKIDQTTREEKE